jgi:uncharacterized Tic20 family protein
MQTRPTPEWRSGASARPEQRLRVTDADRDKVVEHVKAAFAEGRLDKDEMEERLGLAINARTHADLAPITSDLYGTPAPAPYPAHPVPPHHRPGPSPDGGERVGAAFAHALFLIGPLTMMLTGARTSREIRAHALEALNFHLTLLGATILLPMTVVGVVLIPFMWIAAVLLWIVGTVAGLADGGFRYPLTLRLIK